MSSHSAPDPAVEPPAKRVRLTDTETPTTKHAGKVGQCGELDVGITEYVVPDVPGFSGILKQRSVQAVVYNRSTQLKMLMM